MSDSERKKGTMTQIGDQKSCFGHERKSDTLAANFVIQPLELEMFYKFQSNPSNKKVKHDSDIKLDC